MLLRKKLWPVICLLLLLTACGKKQETVVADPEPTSTPPAPIWADATPAPEGLELQETLLEEDETGNSTDTADVNKSQETVKTSETSDSSDTHASLGIVSTGNGLIVSCSHESLKTEITASTCTQSGSMRCICKACGSVMEFRTLAPLEHNWVLTGNEKGHYSVCSLCGSITATEAHTFKNGVCTVCGYGCAHSYKDVVTGSTCLQGGYTTHVCKLCGYSFVDDITPAAGHSYVRQTDAEGNSIFVCTACGEKIEKPDNESTEETQSIDLPEVIID